MKTLVRLALVFAMLFTFSGSAFAMPSPAEYEVKFVGLKESYNIGDKIKLTVETRTSGDVSDIKLIVLPITGGNSDDQVTNVKTTYSQKKYTYTSTGYFKPSSAGLYIIAYRATHVSFEGEKQIEATIVIDVNDPNKISMTVTPDVSHINKGEEVPLLITYTSKSTPKFTYSEKVTELYTKKSGSVYKKVVLFKADKAGEYEIEIEANSKYDTVTKTVEIVVK